MTTEQYEKIAARARNEFLDLCTISAIRAFALQRHAKMTVFRRMLTNENPRMTLNRFKKARNAFTLAAEAIDKYEEIAS